ncbi:High mobility group protein B1 [Myotis davidii]|uniref:High mobility group protein B1 n=1 Tax=Myotis davidii TaxID=225400 RepID=L5MJF8_MYODS|nr:High mobility group protein B1 [Myotis davidii]
MAQHMKNTSESFSRAVKKNIFYAARIISPFLSDNGDKITLLNMWVEMKALADVSDSCCHSQETLRRDGWKVKLKALIPAKMQNPGKANNVPSIIETFTIITFPPSEQGGFRREEHETPHASGAYPGLSIGDVAKKLGEMWNSTAADDKQPHEKKTANLKEKCEKDIAAYRAIGKPDAAKKGAGKAEKKQEKEGRGRRGGAR